jgi:hypothetical protein
LGIRSSLADISLTSLSQCAGNHVETEKQQNEEKRTPTEMRHNADSSFIHFDLSGFKRWSNFCWIFAQG